TPNPVPDQKLITKWRPERLQLLFLQSCQSGATANPAEYFQRFRDNLGSFMQQFLTAGVPAVVAMQDTIAVDAARSFNRGFYESMLESGSVDVGANAGRQLLLDYPQTAWSIPVAATRMKDGAIWTESPLRRAGRLLYKNCHKSKENRPFPDFPIDAISVTSNT